MNHLVLASAAALVASTGAALAGGLAPPIQPLATVQAFVAPTNCPAVQPVVSALQAQGFSRIEVDTGLTQARFSAMRGSEMNTFVYDCASGALLGQNAGTVTAGFEPGIVNVGDDDNSDFVGSLDESDNDDVDVAAGDGAEVDMGTDAGAGMDGGTDAVADAGAGADADVVADADAGANAGTGEQDNGFGNGDDVAPGGSLPNNEAENDQTEDDQGF